MEKKVYTGVVQVGDSYAKKLGFPTINIPLVDSLTGIYVAQVLTGGETYRAAVFANPERKILEGYLLDYSGDLYGKEVSMELIQYVRPSEKFDTEEKLKAA